LTCLSKCTRRHRPRPVRHKGDFGRRRLARFLHPLPEAAMNRLSSVLMCCTVAGLAATGCATAPDEPDAQPRAVVAEPLTGSNIPRRAGKKGVAPVVTLSGEQVKDAMTNTQVPLTRNGQP
jgi:hypothetical protein